MSLQIFRQWLRFSGLWTCSKFYSKSVPTILMYHSVSDAFSWFAAVNPADFRNHLQFLTEHEHDFVTMKRIAEFFLQGKDLSNKSVCLTFDDGFRDNLSDALPILEEFQVPAMIYVATEFVENRQNKKGLPICSLMELRELASHPLISIGAHTRSHPKLSTLSPAEARKEIGGGKALLEDWLGEAVEHFAYPYGDFSTETVTLVEQSGFQTAVTVAPEYVGLHKDRFRLGRVAVDRSVPFWLFPTCCTKAATTYAQLKCACSLK